MRKAIIFVIGSFGVTTAATARDYFTNNDYEPTTGRVGYHMVSNLMDPVSDSPAGCKLELSGYSLQGELPPGLKLQPFVPNADNSATIEGTPRQPGDWDVTITLRKVGCGNTKQYYGDRTVSAHFHIDP